MLRISRFHCLLPMLILISITCLSNMFASDSSFAVVAPLVDDQTFLVGRLDVQKLPLDKVQTRLTAIVDKISGDPSGVQNMTPIVSHIQQVRTAFLEAGGQEVFVLVSTSYAPAPTPFFVVTCAEPGKLDAVQSFVKQLLDASPEKLAVRKHGDRSLLIGQPRTLELLDSLKTEPRAEVTAAANAIAEAPIQLLITPSADQHRVLRETMPNFPQPWDKITGQVVSDGFQWGVLTLEATPTLKANLVIESKDPPSAEQLNTVVATSLDALAQLPIVQQAVPQAGQLLKLLTPTVQDKRLIVSVSEDNETLQAISQPLVAAITAARQNARQAQSINNLKQIGLAMHMYYDKHKRFPPAASYDAAGKPLLSWRVHILPFLDQQVLYNQFKLDEPWDSEHNKKLAETIPVQYLDPAANLQPGLTTYLVPTGEGTVFGGKESLRLADIFDGASNTIMVVNASPDRAVIWTKPEDLVVKEEAPLTGLVSEARQQFETTFCDGSVRKLSNTIDPKVLWLLFQAYDRKPIPGDQIR
ncbi:MAG: DUF1559 domain-containing protein [Pirellulaceae bacterium]